MSTPDDSALLHSRYYDPAKARAYYLRTRQLKGRQPGSYQPPSQSHTPAVKALSPNAKKARREELERQKKALENRLDRLKDILASKVKAAKARSGVVDKPTSTDTKETPEDKANKNQDTKKDTPLTTKQKNDKAKKAHEQYVKDHPSLPQELQALQRQIVDIRAKIKAAVQDAQRKAAMSNSQTAVKGR